MKMLFLPKERKQWRLNISAVKKDDGSLEFLQLRIPLKETKDGKTPTAYGLRIFESLRVHGRLTAQSAWWLADPTTLTLESKCRQERIARLERGD